MDMVVTPALISLEPATIAICKYALWSFYYTSSSLCNCYAREFQNSQNHCHWLCLRIIFIGGSLLDVPSTLGTITARYEGTLSFKMTLAWHWLQFLSGLQARWVWWFLQQRVQLPWERVCGSRLLHSSLKAKLKWKQICHLPPTRFLSFKKHIWA